MGTSEGEVGLIYRAVENRVASKLGENIAAKGQQAATTMLTGIAALKQLKKDKDAQAQEVNAFRTTIPHKDMAVTAGVFLTDAKHGMEIEGSEVNVPN